MVSAWIMGIVGAISTYWIGTRYLGMSFGAVAWALGASNIAGFFSLLLTLALERRPATGRILMGSALKTWSVLVILYVSFMAGLDPLLRNPTTLGALLIPLIWTAGLMLPLWGPTQDRLLAWEHRMAQRPRRPRNQRFARRERDAIRAES